MITSDASEMFLRVRLNPKDQPYHRFVFDSNCYIWNLILFGKVASPNESQKVLSAIFLEKTIPKLKRLFDTRSTWTTLQAVHLWKSGLSQQPSS